jgi:putative Mn2+ efflux pump MntP
MIWGGCTLIGIGLGLFFSQLVGWDFGMPSGILIGLGLAMILQHKHCCEKEVE